MSRVETKADIIRIGTEMIVHGGFNSTGIDSILKKAKVPKGSFYYYFPSKEDFGLAVIDQSAAEYLEKLTGYLEDAKHSPLKRIRNYLEGGLAGQQTNSCKRGCLIGNLGQEMAGQSEKFRKRLEEVLESWRKLFAACLREAQRAGELPKSSDPDQLAGFLLTGWEGAILRSKVMKSVKPMREFIQVFFAKVVK